MLAPQAFLATLCVGLGLFPGVVLQTLGRVIASLPGLSPRSDLVRGGLGMSSGLASFDQVMPMVLGAALLGGFAVAAWVTTRAGVAPRRVPTWGCGGELTARTEYTA